MKFLNEFWEPRAVLDDNQALQFFKSTVLKTNKNKNYYNDWDKIKLIVNKIPQETIDVLNDTLITNFSKEKFQEKVKENPKLLKVINLMLITNDTDINIIDEDIVYYFNLKAKTHTDEEFKVLFKILDLVNFYRPFEEKYVSDIKSYLNLILVGMDTNGRKNRSGTNYEDSTKELLNEFTNNHGFKSLSGANEKKVKAIFGDIVLEKIKSTGKKIPDYVFQTSKNIYLVETNYSDGGSKLQETIKSYIDLNNTIKSLGNIKFIYFTDGKQWTANSSHLTAGWKGIDYIVNTKMIKEGILEYILKEEEK